MNSSKKKNQKSKANSYHQLVEANKSIAALKAELHDCQRRLSLTGHKIGEHEETAAVSSSPESTLEHEFEKTQPNNITEMISGDEFQENLASRLPYLPAAEAEEVLVPAVKNEEPVIQQSIEATKPPIETKATRNYKPSKVSHGVIKELHLQQSNQAHRVLKAEKPVFVYSKLNLPTAPSPENADIDIPTYGLRVVIQDAQSEKRNWTTEFADDLVFGVTEYENMIELPCLAPGTYAMNFYAVVPFIRTTDEKSLTFTISG